MQNVHGMYPSMQRHIILCQVTHQLLLQPCSLVLQLASAGLLGFPLSLQPVHMALQPLHFLQLDLLLLLQLVPQGQHLIFRLGQCC